AYRCFHSFPTRRSSDLIVLTYAAYATKADCAVLEFSGHSFTDSFDSSIGPYAKTHANMRGDIAVNGNAKLRDQVFINGSVYMPRSEEHTSELQSLRHLV